MVLAGLELREASASASQVLAYTIAPGIVVCLFFIFVSVLMQDLVK